MVEHLPQVRCICCGLDFRGGVAARDHHDQNRAWCLKQRKDRLGRLRGQNPAMPAIMELLLRCDTETTVLEKINAANPKWLNDICEAHMAWKMKEKLIRKAAVDPAFALSVMDPHMADAITSLELLAAGLEPDEAKVAWDAFFEAHY